VARLYGVKRIFRALCSISRAFDFNYPIRQIAPSNMFRCGSQKFPLMTRTYVGNNDSIRFGVLYCFLLPKLGDPLDRWLRCGTLGPAIYGKRSAI
jgi:hypothetical protein